MSVTQSVRRQPPIRNSDISPQMQYWELETQQSAPLNKVDTSKGPLSVALPAAGLNPGTGQTNQNQEVTYIKTSADMNIATITGAQGGPYTLIAQFDVQKFKSDGTYWWPTT